MLMIQTICLVGFFVFPVAVAHDSGRLPWWFELYQCVPLITEAAFLALLALPYRMNELWVWA